MARKIFKADEAEAKYIENSSAGKFKQDDALFQSSRPVGRLAR